MPSGPSLSPLVLLLTVVEAASGGVAVAEGTGCSTRAQSGRVGNHRVGRAQTGMGWRSLSRSRRASSAARGRFQVEPGLWSDWRGKRHRALRVASSASDMDYAMIRFKIPGVDETKLPGYIGAIGLAALVVNHLTSEFIPEVQVRSEVLGSLMGALCLTIPSISHALDTAAGLEERAQPLANTQQTIAIAKDVDEASKLEAAWALTSLVLNTNVHRVMVVRNSDGKVMATRGFFNSQLLGSSGADKEVLLENLTKEVQPMLSKIDQAKGIYCRDSREISALNPNGLGGLATRDAGTLFVAPVGTWGQLWALTDAPRALTRSKDRRWLALVAKKLQSSPAFSDPNRNAPGTLDVEDEMLLKDEVDKPGARDEDAPTQENDTKGLEGIIIQNQSRARALPLLVGFSGLTTILANRLISATTPTDHVTQADLTSGALATTLTLTGLIWSDAVRPKDPVPVDLSSTSKRVLEIASGLQDSSALAAEMRWVAQSLETATRAKSVLILTRDCQPLLRSGLMSRTENVSGDAGLGPVCQRALETGQGSYIPNLILNSGRGEFFGYGLPDKTQGVLVKPIMVAAQDGEASGSQQGAVMVIGTDTVRGFSSRDQAWVAALAEKLGVTFSYTSTESNSA